MSDLYSQHKYLVKDLHEDQKTKFISMLNQDVIQTEVESAIKKLSHYLQEKFGEQPIILIDEYDTPIQTSYLEGYYDQMIKLMRNILGESLKDNIPMSKAVITGITRIAQESLFSGVNNFEAYSVLKPKYGQYFGFIEEEVTELIRRTDNQASLDLVRGWYNGYRIGPNLIYNPWSILMCLKNNGAIGPHWLNTSSNELLKNLIEQANRSIQRLI